MENGQYVDGSVWFYAPNKAAPVFFALAFAASGCWHIWQCVQYKSWRLTGLMVFCSVCFTGGFIVREMGAFDTSNLVKYIISICLIYAAPPLYELSNYYVLGRILYYVPYLSPLHPGRVLTTFAIISAVVEALNGNGASRVANTSLPQSQQDIGHNLFKAALAIQLAVIAAFLALAGIFHRRCRRRGIDSPKLYKALHTLYLSEALLTVRTVYRVVEYWAVANIHLGPGTDPMSLSPLVRYEWFFYVFEASLMLANQVLLNVRHPRMFLPKSTKTYLGTDGVTEVKGPGYVDKRPFWVTLVDPFDLHGRMKGRKKDEGDRFWERGDGEAVVVGKEEDAGKTDAREIV